MTNTDIWTLIVGFFLPLLFAIIVQTDWSASLKQVITFIAYMACAVFIWFFVNDKAQFDGWRGYVNVFVHVILGGLTGYFTLWRRTVAPKVEAETNF